MICCNGGENWEMTHIRLQDLHLWNAAPTQELQNRRKLGRKGSVQSTMQWTPVELCVSAIFHVEIIVAFVLPIHFEYWYGSSGHVFVCPFCVP